MVLPLPSKVAVNTLAPGLWGLSEFPGTSPPMGVHEPDRAMSLEQLVARAGAGGPSTAVSVNAALHIFANIRGKARR